MIMLHPNDRNPNTFLEASLAEYSTLIEASSLLYKNIKKDLLNIDEYFKDGKISDDTSSIAFMFSCPSRVQMYSGRTGLEVYWKSPEETRRLCHDKGVRVPRTSGHCGHSLEIPTSNAKVYHEKNMFENWCSRSAEG